MAKVPLFAIQGSLAIATGTTIVPITGTQIPISETNLQLKYTTAGTFSQMQCKLTSNSMSVNCIYRFRKNAADGNQVITVPAGVSGIFQDNTNTDTVAAGDLLNYAITGGGTGTVTNQSMAIAFAATTNTVIRYNAVGNDTNTGASQTLFGCFLGDPVTGTVEANTQFRMKAAGTLQKMAVFLSDNARTASTYTSRKNTAAGLQSVSVTASTTGRFEDTTHTDTIAVNDLINFRLVTGTGTASMTTVQVTVEFVNTGGVTVFGAQDDAPVGFSINQTIFGDISHKFNLTTVDSSNIQTPMPGSYTLSKFQIKVNTNSVTAASTGHDRINGANGNQTVSITASTTGYFEDASNTTSVAAGDVADYLCTVGSTGTTLRVVAWGLLAQEVVLTTLVKKLIKTNQAVNRANVF